MLCDVVLRYVMLCHVMLCYVILRGAHGRPRSELTIRAHDITLWSIPITLFVTHYSWDKVFSFPAIYSTCLEERVDALGPNELLVLGITRPPPDVMYNVIIHELSV